MKRPRESSSTPRDGYLAERIRLYIGSHDDPDPPADSVIKWLRETYKKAYEKKKPKAFKVSVSNALRRILAAPAAGGTSGDDGGGNSHSDAGEGGRDEGAAGGGGSSSVAGTPEVVRGNNLNNSMRETYKETTTPVPTPTPREKRPKRQGSSKSGSGGGAGGGGGGGAAAPKVVMTDRPDLRFSDLGGIEDCLQDVREIIAYPLAHPEIYIHLGALGERVMGRESTCGER